LGADGVGAQDGGMMVDWLNRSSGSRGNKFARRCDRTTSDRPA
jgi:hypothetical protein